MQRLWNHVNRRRSCMLPRLWGVRRSGFDEAELCTRKNETKDQA